MAARSAGRVNVDPYSFVYCQEPVPSSRRWLAKYKNSFETSSRIEHAAVHDQKAICCPPITSANPVDGPAQAHPTRYQRRQPVRGPGRAGPQKTQQGPLSSMASGFVVRRTQYLNQTLMSRDRAAESSGM